jgi:hypothetical protein
MWGTTSNVGLSNASGLSDGILQGTLEGASMKNKGHISIAQHPKGVTHQNPHIFKKHIMMKNELSDAGGKRKQWNQVSEGSRYTMSQKDKQEP